ncbi:peptide/nickel transport system permease protein [Microbacterium terrae]|uniref:Glutathione transport system permease protein GsiD n=1 Tax=Microbacterium terrae TaxID=69369 RepID=A0A0M2HLM5_9MICO|nr:ABC transporter permease [Microbacterium terrae]KJL45325.1 Glutathione transport system permease protein GsiD [Microbacterium terrae]MBP1078427.1 peptide/nickel transport system permease protein [Microbacterium terrae]GLJ99327.1 peptide ABC transporter permease [Microbacterium terrae]
MTIELDSPVVAAPTPPPAATPAARRVRAPGLRAVFRQPVLVLAWIIVIVVIGWALAPSLFTPYSPYEGDPALSFAPPSLEHPLGADRLGRDQLARTIYGAGTTLTATLIAVVIAFGIGTVVGLIAGFAGRFTDTALMRVIDVFLSIPSLLLAMVIVSVLGYSTQNIAIAVGIGSIAAFARVMRSEVIGVVGKDYVRAAYGSGVTRLGVVLRHVVPNSLGSVIALAALEVGTAILAVASLGFLGYGAPPPEPEWGLLVAEGRDYLAAYPWVSILPGIALAAVVIATHRISTSFRGKDRR